MSKKRKNNDTLKSRNSNVIADPFYVKHFQILFLLVLSFFIYANTIPNNYNLDDELVTQNHRLTSKGLSAVYEIFTEPYYKDATGYSYEYRPIVLLSFAIEHQFFGDNPHVSHFFNLILYAILSAFFFIVLRKLLGDKYILLSFIAAIVFSIHPAHTEVVASIKNRDEILALIFSFCALYYSMRYIDDQSRSSLLFSAFLFSVALMSKLTVTSFIIFIPVAIIYFRKPELKMVLAITFLYSVPLFFLSNINLLLSRFYFLAGVFSINIFMFFLVRYYSTIDWRKSLNSIWDFLKIQFNRIYDNNSSKTSLPANLIFNLSITIVFLLFFILSINDYLRNDISAFKFNIVFCFILFLFVSWEYKVFLSAFFIGISAFLVYELKLPDFYLSQFFIFPLIYLILLSKGVMRFFLLLMLILIIGMEVFGEVKRFWIYLLLATIYFIPKLSTYKKYIVGLSFLIFIWFFVRKVSHSAFYIDFVFFSILLIWFAEQGKIASKKILSITIAASLLFLFIYFSIHPYTPIHTTQITLPSVDLQYVNAPKIIESVNRPINFVETPVDMNSPIDIRLGTSMDIFARYLKLTFIPYPLAFYYGYSFISPVSFWSLYPIAVFLLILILGIVIIVLHKRSPIISFALFVFSISLISFLPIFTAIPGMMADRYLFIPSIGFSLVLGYLILYYLNIKDFATTFFPKSNSARQALFLIFLIYSGLTIARNFDWKDRVTLFSKDIKHVSSSAQAQNLVALHIGIKANQEPSVEEQKRLRELSCNHFYKAIEIYPDFLNPTFDLGRTLTVLGRYDEAIKAFKSAIRIKPTYSPSYTSLGILFDNNRTLDSAVLYYEKSIEVNPRNLVVYNNLSYVYFRQNRLDKSIEVNKKAITQFPTAYQPYLNVGKTYLNQNMLDSALVYIEKGYQYNTNDYDMTNLLFQLYQAKNDSKALYYRGKLSIIPKPQ